MPAQARSALYYLSWGCFYSTPESVWWSYQHRGSFIEPALIKPAFRVGNESQTPRYSRKDYVDRHGSFVRFRGEDYWMGNE